MYNKAGYMYSVWPLKKLSLTPKYSIDITLAWEQYNVRQFETDRDKEGEREIETQREWAKELTNFHHRISFYNRSLVFGNIKRCGIIRISSLAMWVLVYVKMCATYNRPLYVYPTHGNLICHANVHSNTLVRSFALSQWNSWITD